MGHFKTFLLVPTNCITPNEINITFKENYYYPDAIPDKCYIN